MIWSWLSVNYATPNCVSHRHICIKQMDKELAGNVDLNGAFREDESETESEDSEVNIDI